MGRSSPLDHAELRDVESLLDKKDLAEAQRQLALLGARAELADGVAYLTTRLLFARGRLDASGVADRLRDLVHRDKVFPEAEALLSQAERGHISFRPPLLGFESESPPS